MKKRITAIITALVLSISAIPVFAQNVTAAEEDIIIIYNGETLLTELAPQNINGRVMVPFRALLEKFGAEVDFEEETRTVKAQRDDISISFSLDDDVIDIDKAGEKSELKMDVPATIYKDRTLVPIRFMSTALGMRVGWDGYFETVFIYDADAYAKTIEERCPNLVNMSELSTKDFNVADYTFRLDLNVEDMAETIIDLSVESDISSLIAGGRMSADSSFDFSVFGDDLGDLRMKDITFGMLMDSDAIYLKTNLFHEVAKLSKYYPEAIGEDFVKKIESIPTGQWYKITLKEIQEEFGLTDSAIEVLKNALSDKEKEDFSKTLSQMFMSEDDINGDEAYALGLYETLFATLDKYVKVSGNASAMEVSFVITSEDLVDICKGFMPNATEETIKEALDGLDVKIDVNSKAKGNTAVSEGNITLNYDGITLNVEIFGTDKLNKNAEPPKIPNNAIDLAEFFY